MITEELIRQVAHLQRKVDGLIKPEVNTFNPATSRWATWTLTITQGVTVTHTPTFMRYFNIGGMIVVAGRTTCTSSGTAGQGIVLTGMPDRVAAHKTNTSAVGVGLVREVTPGLVYYEATMIFGTNDGLSFIVGGTNNFLGALPNIQLVSGWTMGFTVAYEGD